jgi:hypothetical protein
LILQGKLKIFFGKPARIQPVVFGVQRGGIFLMIALRDAFQLRFGQDGNAGIGKLQGRQVHIVTSFTRRSGPFGQ